MQGLEPSVVTNQYKSSAKIWRSTLEIGQNLSILFFPYSDRARRIEQFIEDITTDKHATYHTIFIFIDPLLINIEEKNDLTDYITSELLTKHTITKKESFDEIIKYLSAKKIRIVLTLITAESVLLQSNKYFLSALYQVLTAYNPCIVSVSCFETDVTHPQYAETLRQYPKLLQSIFYYPFYGKKDTEHFIHHMATIWDIHITQKQIDHITSICGGKWWFIKDALRQLRTQKTWNEETDDMMYRKNMIIQALLPSERSGLLKILTGRKTFDKDEQHSINHLMKLRVITDDYHITIPILRKPLLASINSVRALTYENNMIYLNQVPIGKFFSRKEIRAFKILVSKPGVIISREELAQAIWPIDTDANYSDWAIDQIIARVRKRLPEFDISPSCIKSIRGKGYMYIQL